MITLSKSGNTIVFEFDDNSGYLQNGTIEVPLNSLSLITDESDMATFRKSASNDIFVSARYDDFGMTKAELEQFYKDNMVGSTGGGGGGITSGEVQTMIDESISGKVDTSTFETYSGNVETALGGKQDTLIAGDGISIYSNDTINTYYRGWADFEQYDFRPSGSFYVVVGFDCVGYTNGSARFEFEVDNERKEVTIYFDASTGSWTCDSWDDPQICDDLWQYLNIYYNGDSIFLVEPYVEVTVNDNGCVRFTYDLIGGGTTTDALDAVFGNLENKADTSAVTEAISGKVDTDTFETYSGSVDSRFTEDELVTGEALNDLNNRVDELSGNTITSGEVQTMISAAVSGKQDTLVEGVGIQISGDTITATYNGYPIIEQTESYFESRTEDFYMIGGLNCSEEYGFVVLDNYNDSSWTFKLEMDTHQWSLDSYQGEEDGWTAYMDIEWDDSVKLFKATVKQEIPFIGDATCGGVIDPSGITFEGSGTTKDAFDSAFDKIKETKDYVDTTKQDLKHYLRYFNHLDLYQEGDLYLAFGDGYSGTYDKSVKITDENSELFVNSGLEIKPIVNSRNTTWNTIIKATEKYFNIYKFPSFTYGYDKVRFYYNSGFTFDDTYFQIAYYIYDEINQIWSDAEDYFVYDSMNDTFVDDNVPNDFSITKTNEYIEVNYTGSSDFYFHHYTSFPIPIQNNYFTKVDMYGAQLLHLQEAYDSLQGGGGGGGITSGEVQTMIDESISGKADTSAVTEAISAATSGITETVELTQAEYDALVSGGTVNPTTYYIITDASPIDLSVYVQKSSIVTSVTSGSTDTQIPSAKCVYDALGDIETLLSQI